MNAHPILLQKKYARIVALFAEQVKLPLGDALDFFYRSSLYDLLKNGISDIHCMSDGYLADELEDEFRTVVAHGE